MPALTCCGGGRHLAPEAIRSQRFSTASDVYALGALVAEVYGRGKAVHSELTDEALLAALRSEGQLPRAQQPEGCPGGVWRVAQACMREAASKRPALFQINNDLRDERSGPQRWEYTGELKLVSHLAKVCLLLCAMLLRAATDGDAGCRATSGRWT